MTKKASILNIGTELLVGHVLNTHANYLSKRLNDLGFGVYYHLTCGDNPERIEKALDMLVASSDLIIVTGGLGPTQDDITREIIAKKMGVPLMLDPDVRDHIATFFKGIGRQMTPNNERQAYFPQDAICLKNPYGTAPGFVVRYKTTQIACLPGPPREMKGVFEESLMPMLLENGSRLFSRFITLYGIGESTVDHTIKDLFATQSDPSIGIYAHEGYLSLRLSTMKTQAEDADAVMMPLIKQINQLLGPYVVSTEGLQVHHVLYDLLLKHGLTISFAESCTGGMLSAQLTEVPGSSAVFNGSVITYADSEKTKRLKVPKALLEAYGAVSKEVCQAMLSGLKETYGSQVGIAVTGIAGPGGARPDKPVGLVYIGVYVNDQVTITEHHFPGNRDRIRLRTMHQAYLSVITALKALNDA